MKKKGTRKIRKNRRTQRRKNRSYKRMRGGDDDVKQRINIMKLLKNLIINNLEEDSKIELCRKQQTSITPTATEQQPLLLKPVLLEDIQEVDELIKESYKSLINQKEGKYQFIFNPDDIKQKHIIAALKTKEITYFDRIVKNSVLDILSPIEFNNSLSSSRSFSKPISDTLVYSMFALSVTLFYLLSAIKPNSIVYKVDPIECPSTANV